ncbi:MAG: TonB-dependent receptor [Chitinispirillaceae bacterium]|nr:TonB-dependent receptor [Chitinispirillaceae bacterium]
MHVSAVKKKVAILLLLAGMHAGTASQMSESPYDEMTIEMPLDEELDTAAGEDSFVVDKMPVLETFIQAHYPPQLVKRGISGVVLLDLLINEKGTVDSVGVVTGVHPSLDSNAVAAAKQFVFSPAMSGNDSVAVLLQYQYRFTIDDVIDSIKPYVNFKGRFLEKGTRTPIADAMVVVKFLDSIDQTLPLPFHSYLKKISAIEGQHLEEGMIVTSTDSSGNFSFFSLPACSIKVQMIAPGYEQYASDEKITKEELVEGIFYVQRLSYGEYEIVVYGKTEEKEVSRHQITVQEIRKIPGLGGDAVKVVQAMPGVARPAFGSGEVIVRGSPGWDTRYFLDGVTMPMLYHFGGLKSVYNSEALKSIDFYPGGFGTCYGGAVGGAIEIKGKKAADDRLHLKLDLSTLDGYFLAEGPVNEKVSVMASGRRSFIGEIMSWYIKNNRDKFYMTISPFYWDYLIRTDIKVSKKHNLFVTLFGSRDSLTMLLTEASSGSDELSGAKDKIGQNETFHMVMAGWDAQLNDRMTNTLREAFTYHRVGYTILGWASSKQCGITNTLRDQLSIKLTERTKLNLGLDVELTSVDVILGMLDGGNKVVRDTNDNWLFGVAGTYANLEIKPIPALQIIPGMRYDYYPELDYDGSIAPEFWDYKKYDGINCISGEPSFRLNSRWQFAENQTVKASAGNYNQTPQPFGQVIHKRWGEPKMPATKAVHYVAGHEWQITDIINSDVQFYFNRQWNIPVMVSNPGNSQQEDKKWSRNGIGRMWGMELMLRHLQTSRFFGWVAYTLSRAERYNHTAKKWELYDNDQIHNLQVLGSWHLKKEYDVGFRARYVSGNPTTPIVGVIEHATDNDYTPHFEPVPGKKNSKRVDPFFQLDLRIDKKFVFDKWMFSTYVDFQNISYFFYKSPEMWEYNYDYSEKMTVSMPPMIAVGFKTEF